MSGEDIKFGEDPDELAALVETLTIHVSDLGDDAPKNVKQAIESLPSRFYITRRMSITEIGWLRNKVRELWKLLTGKDISDFKTVPAPKHATEYDGNFWLLPGGIAVHAFNHFTAAKKHKGLICSLLDINAFVFERKMLESPMVLISFLLQKGASRMNVDRERSQVIIQCSEGAWPWTREKLRSMVHKKKVARILDPTKPYEGWSSGIPVRVE
jgi:hypothetical protein